MFASSGSETVSRVPAERFHISVLAEANWGLRNGENSLVGNVLSVGGMEIHHRLAVPNSASQYLSNRKS